MKKVVMIAAAVLLTVGAQAQDKTYKPVAGMSSLELTFNPSAIFNASTPGATFGLPATGGLNQGVKYRSWANENTVRRGTFLLGFKNSSVATVLFNGAGDRVDAKDTYFEWALQLRPGIEHHFAGTKRLSPYVGSELIIGVGANSYTTESLDAADAIVESYVKNGNQDFAGNGLPWTYANGFTLGASLVAGFDYYIAESLYLGLEMNYAFIFNNGFNVKAQTPGNAEVETKKGSNWYFNPSAGANLRIGWNF